MHRSIRIASVCAALALAVTPAFADTPAELPAGVRGELIGSMMDAGGKIMELADAVPEKKYAWKPGKGVRSASDVFLHVATANYLIPSLMGAKSTMSMDDAMKLEKTPMDKAKVLSTLKDSYESAKQAIAGIPDADLEAPVEFFGMKMTKRAGILLLVSHSHEHLGQSIAYARSMGITPPWTARQEAEAAKKAAEKKASGGK